MVFSDEVHNIFSEKVQQERTDQSNTSKVVSKIQNFTQAAEVSNKKQQLVTSPTEELLDK